MFKFEEIISYSIFFYMYSNIFPDIIYIYFLDIIFEKKIYENKNIKLKEIQSYIMIFN